MRIFVYGGSCCGKSEFAESLIMRDPSPSRVYIATMEVYDGESVRRVERHRRMRAEKGFATVEAQRELAAAARLVPEGSAVLLECLGNLSANELFPPSGERTAEETAELVTGGLLELEKRCSLLVSVSNDIFSGDGSYGGGTLRYCGALGAINRWAAERADLVYEVVCGIPVLIKGEDLT